MKPVLEIQSVSKYMGKKKILDNVSFTVNAGEVFGFLGPNGAGKTTTIKMATGLLSIKHGSIKINGVNVNEDFEKALSKVGAIIENPEMYGYMSGWDNLKLYSRMHDGVTEERIKQVVDMVKLTGRINDKVKKYSLGMRQRLGVAQALLHKPDLLILDEPTNGLDPEGIKELRDTLRHLAESENVAVLVSSHLLSEMELMCDRFGIIDNGVILEIKTLEEASHQNENDTLLYEFETNNMKKAESIIASMSNAQPERTGNTLSCELTKDTTALIINELVKNNVLVYGVSPHKKSLEEAFMEITHSHNADSKKED